ncbi:MAG: response regulator transcription factor [Methylothermaceae bacterium]|nr:response regulator transcription factor [Methylothermaceae bacterium]
MNPYDRESAETVMIVDDAPANLAYLSDALEDAGYRVLVATDGSQALEQLRLVSPDLLLLDVVMPGMDGFETCRRLKSHPATKTLPILFMTALSELDDLLRGFGEGAVDYLVKPVRHQEVLARVAAQLAQVKLIRKAEAALSQGGFAAVAADADCRITWITPAAVDWLEKLSEASNTEWHPTAAQLPEPLAEWMLRQLEKAKEADQASFTFQRSDHRWIANGDFRPNQQEYLLLLQQRSMDWQLGSLQKGYGLTVREAEILMWVARSKTNREVGQILGISHRTVNKHLEHIFEKLGVATRAAAVAAVMEQIHPSIESLG